MSVYKIVEYFGKLETGEPLIGINSFIAYCHARQESEKVQILTKIKLASSLDNQIRNICNRDNFEEYEQLLKELYEKRDNLVENICEKMKPLMENALGETLDNLNSVLIMLDELTL